ncbi:MAG: hypothetical protein ABR974_00865 [Bacteroidales bacterium]|jgi:hypothetical protein
MGTNPKKHWEIKKEKFKNKFPAVSDKDLNYHEGEEREMLKILGNKIDKTEQELLNIILWL